MKSLQIFKSLIQTTYLSILYLYGAILDINLIIEFIHF